MKFVFVFFLMIALSANAFVGTGICSMAHDNISNESHAMPCHDSEASASTVTKQDTNTHWCDCDMCVQFVAPAYNMRANAPMIDSPIFNGTFYRSLNPSVRYRPPINLSS